MNSTATRGYFRRNVGLSVVASLLSAVSLFAVFRIAGEVVGFEWLGAWSLIQGMMLIARIADSGAAANITREVARRYRTAGRAPILRIGLAASIIASLPASILAGIIAVPVGLFMTEMYGGALNVSSLHTLILLAVVAAVLSSFASVLLAVVEGAFLLNAKSRVIIVANIIATCVGVPLLWPIGPAAIGLVYVLMAGAQLVGALTVLIRESARRRFRDTIRIRDHIRALWRENAQLSLVAIIRLTFEPLTKVLLSLVAPLPAIASFELALRVSTQIRVTVQAAMQPLVALGARRPGEADEAAQRTFRKSHNLIAPASLILALAQFLAAPAISLAGLGGLDEDFVMFFILLAIGGSLNIAGLSGYTFQLTSGAIAPLLAIQASMAAVNGGAGAVGVMITSPPTVVGAYALAFAIGGFACRLLLPVPLSAVEIGLVWLAPIAGGAAIYTAIRAALSGGLAEGPIVVVGCVAALALVAAATHSLWKARRKDE
ncbi:hypothetical protein [Microbacterium terricola]|uniref:Membrane protein involved in the export of O-antigen and teichoic acid n=1 Tax=Microbacterium terricola TaxID=344163 RepID=A0ABM8DVU8_9MICO|nr:hypothetical protein [Microbacterium terricola]UYK39488.1 hypothetical protein OAU46_12375 [Microbacterium terricola]BDV29783.1 hypothetical protein Microterr_04430 [Microbacterium terricola]